MKVEPSAVLRRGSSTSSMGSRTSWSDGSAQSHLGNETLDRIWNLAVDRCRRLCGSWRFSLLTTVLTVCALFGDDFRQAATHQDADDYFNTLTLLCLVVFTVEIVASSIGKDGYFMGFFFLLDLGATVTLLFDLTWVWSALACQSTNGNTGAIRTSRAGRAGARAARTVRIVRLIRLVKLYKSYQSAIQHKDKRRKGAAPDKPAPGEGEEDDLLKEEDQEENIDRKVSLEHSKSSSEKGQQDSAETRVGKKLSDMTTRRVIVLVLVMLFAMPMFGPSAYGFDDLRTSADLGTEFIYERLRVWCLSNSTNGALPWCLQALETPEDDRAEERYLQRSWYEQFLLSYIYQHQTADYAWDLYWIGFQAPALASSIGDTASGAYLSEWARLNQPRFLGTHTTDTVQSWNSQFQRDDWQAPFQELSGTVLNRLTSPWTEKCSGFYGVAVSGDGASGGSCTTDANLRCSETQTYIPWTRTSDESQQLNVMFVFDCRGSTQLEAGLSMLQTVFICLAVGLGAMSFSNDANQLLLNPIARMIAKMEAIKDNPLHAMRLGDLEFRREEIEQARRKEQMENASRCWKLVLLSWQTRKPKEPMETMILEKTIIKLGGLLALGFGEAGAEIIGQNMRGGHSAGVNAMVPGVKVDAIIGFCNIRNFTDATEVLKEKVMLFVNQIGEIVHGCVDDYHGAPNKNIGDCFLLVWRLSGAQPDRQTKLADMAVMSFVRITAEINKSRVLAVYRDHPGLLQRLPKYRVQMGFGLHCGWAIEGAIGSEFKIDASYLSPNVNVASRLEAATEQFGVSMLVSHFMLNLCSPEMAAYCRQIDHVTVKGSKQPIRLYTIDLDYMALSVEQKRVDRVVRNRYKMRQIREARKSEKWAEDHKVWKAFATDMDLRFMRARYSPEFFLRFSMAFRNYEAGQWMVARDMLFTCHYTPRSDLDGSMACREDDWPVDGPTNTLLFFMKQSHYYPPNDWTGYRELTQK